METVRQLLGITSESQTEALQSIIEYMENGTPYSRNRLPDFEELDELIEAAVKKVKEDGNLLNMRVRGELILLISGYRDLKASWAPDYLVHRQEINGKLRQHYNQAAQHVMREAVETTTGI